MCECPGEGEAARATKGRSGGIATHAFKKFYFQEYTSEKDAEKVRPHLLFAQSF